MGSLFHWGGVSIIVERIYPGSTSCTYSREYVGGLF
jgi:hypothetical protein